MLGFVHQKANPIPKPKKFPAVAWILAGFLLVCVVYFSFEKSVKKDQNGQIIGISEAQQAKFRADSLKLTKCVQYALIALKSGFYERCDGQGEVFLLVGEVYKYGFTCEQNPLDRYSKNYLQENHLDFEPQFFGTILDCQTEEKRKLYLYPILPENLKRPENKRLILPIGNCKTN